MTNPTNEHQQQNERCNIFRIIESADKELMHSSMIRFFLQSKLSNDISDLFKIKNENKLTINLEESHSYETQSLKNGFKAAQSKIGIINPSDELVLDSNKKKHRLRFDIVGRLDNKLTFIIENKFKAIPTVHQLKMYDAAIECELGLPQNQDQYPQKILMVLLRQQISRELEAYLKLYKWNVVSYLDDVNANHSYKHEDNPQSLWSLLTKKNSIQLDPDRKYIFESYTEILKDHQDALKILWNSEYITKYNDSKSPLIIKNNNEKYTPYDFSINHRFLFLQYLVAIQTSIDNKVNLEIKNAVINDVYKCYSITNNGSAQNDPSVAFWYHFTKEEGAIIPTLFFSIDGMTAKIGISYYREKRGLIKKEIEELRKFDFGNIGEYLPFKKNSKDFKAANDESINGTSVYALFVFSIEGLKKEDFIEQSANLINHIFSNDTINKFNESFNHKNNS